MAPRVSRGPTVVASGNRGLGIAHFRQAKRKLASGPARRVDLVVVRIVDDLPLRDEPAAASANFWSSTTVKAKLPQASTPRCCLRATDVDLREIALREPGGSHHDVRAVLERGQDVGLGAVRFGVFDEDVARIGERLCGRSVDATGEARLAQHVAQDTAGVLARDRGDERRGPRPSRSSARARNPPNRLPPPDIL